MNLLVSINEKTKKIYRSWIKQQLECMNHEFRRWVKGYASCSFCRFGAFAHTFMYWSVIASYVWRRFEDLHFVEDVSDPPTTMDVNKKALRIWIIWFVAAGTSVPWPAFKFERGFKCELVLIFYCFFACRFFILLCKFWYVYILCFHGKRFF